LEKLKTISKKIRSLHALIVIYGHMAKNYKKPRKKQDTRKCYKYKKMGHIVEDCKAE